MQSKVTLALLTVDMYTINVLKHFSRLSHYNGVTDKENRIAVIDLHKCGIERARTFELLKLLNIACVL